MEQIETIVVGAGQAGLATSYCLKKNGSEHLVLERGNRPADSWRNRCWDTFTLVTPGWAFKIPGIDIDPSRHDEFLSRSEVTDLFENYVTQYDLPVKYNTQVLSISREDHDEYIVETSQETYRAKNVVMAIGFFQKPNIPVFAKNLAPAIRQMHTSEYRNAASVAQGSTLIVGSGQSGCQIAEELLHAGKRVFLCVGKAGRAPRRYRGKDIIEWLFLAGFFDLTPEQLPPGIGKFGGVPHLSGANGGHTINLHEFARRGVTLLGHLRDARGAKVFLAPDLHQNLEVVDGFETNVTKEVDELIIAKGLNAPPEKLPQLRYGYDQPIIGELDLEKEKIGTVIWATGYSFDYSLVRLPVVDEDGFPVQTRGATNYAGLYFVGVPWMPSEKTGFLLGVGDEAERIAGEIAHVSLSKQRYKHQPDVQF